MWLGKFIFALFVCTVAGNLFHSPQDVNVSLLAKEIKRFAEYGVESEFLKEALYVLRLPTELQSYDWKSLPGLWQAAACTLCQATMKTYMELYRHGMPIEKIEESVTNICIATNLQSKRVCVGAIKLNTPIIQYIVDNRPNLTATTICGVVLETQSCPLTDPAFDWTISVPPKSPIQITEQDTQENIEILHVTDLHYDPLYEPNGNNDCGEPCCCRKGQNDKGEVEGSGAGYWGDYGSCDTPWHAVVDALEHMRETHTNVSYVYFTGDVIDHGVWETSKEGNTEALIKSYDKIYETFLGLPVFPILGNHEPHPLNQFAPKWITREDLTTQWVYELLADLWIGYKWLPESTRASILEGGYYTVSPKKGFRVIVLNSNVCYSYNWWILYEPRDPGNQLKWLTDVLLEAEKQQEFVHILSHIPPNNNACVRTWKREYLKIIDRFSHVVRAEFNGHTHNDEIAVLFGKDSTVGKNVAWNGGSVTGYAKLNPNYKVFQVNAANYDVTDYDNWMYDLNVANQNPNVRPKWYKSYSFKEEYGIQDLSAKSLTKFLYALANNEKVHDKYYRHFYKQAEHLNKKCDANCKKNFACRAIASAETKSQICNRIQNSKSF